MANEATIVELTGYPQGCPRRYNISGGIAIEKGTLMVLSGAALSGVRAIIASPATNGPVANFFPAGVAATEKVAGDSDATIGVWTQGVVDLYFDIGLSGGNLVCFSGANVARPAMYGDVLSGMVVGRLIESIGAGSYGNVALML